MGKMCFGFNSPPKKKLIQQCNQAVCEGGKTLSYYCIPLILTHGAPSHSCAFRIVCSFIAALPGVKQEAQPFHPG